MSYSAINTITAMRNIISSLRQSETQNADMAGHLAQTQINEAANLNQNIGNVPQMAENAQQSAGALHQMNAAENNSAFQLAKLEEMLDELEGHLP